MDETVTITKDEYQKLLESQRKLSCLESAGVDNWEGYEYAMDMYTEEFDDFEDE